MARVLSPGDIALVDLGRRFGQAGAIRVDGAWACKLSEGVYLMFDDHVRVVAAWHVPGDHARALTAFLQRVAQEPFRHGSRDCAMTVADWVQSRTGRDPGASLRDRYTSERAWRRVARDAGGLEPLFDRLAASAGLTRIV